MGTSHSVHTYIHVEANFSFPGGTVAGVVNINATSATPAGELFIRLAGTESANWASKPNSSSTYSQKLQFFEQLYPIWHFDGTINKGQFTIPFSIQLPADIVPSFSIITIRETGSITYTLEAYVKDSSMILAYQTIIWINSLMDQSLVSPPLQDSKSLNVRNCLCFKKGVTDITVEVFRPLIVMDEDINFSLRIDNSKNKYAVRTITCSLVRGIRLRAKSFLGKVNNIIPNIFDRAILDVNIPPGGSEESERFISIPVSLKTRAADLWQTPSVANYLIECEYGVKVELRFDNCCSYDVYDIYIPVRIHNGKYVVNTRFSTPPELSIGWNPIELASAPVHVESFVDSTEKHEDSAHLPTHEDTQDISSTG